MANLSIHAAPAVALPTPKAAAEAPKETPKLVQQAQALEQDSVSIKHGILPTLKGAGAGVVAGGVLAGAGSLAAAKAMRAEYADLAVLLGGGLGAVAGGVTGAVVANVTDNKSKAALWGAAVGGVVGFGLGMVDGNIKAGVTWAALGIGAGLGGSFAGAAVAQRK